jgi:hypothetical protein
MVSEAPIRMGFALQESGGQRRPPRVGRFHRVAVFADLKAQNRPISTHGYDRATKR